MRILLDHDVPHGLRRKLSGYEVVTAQHQGWADLNDDALLDAAEGEFAVLVTLDTNLIHQQDVGARELGVVIVDLHPVVPDHLTRHLENVRSALPIAAKEQSAVVVREDGIDIPPL
jgi:predicted nuclease of predicted toxin-antitoxin system